MRSKIFNKINALLLSLTIVGAGCSTADTSLSGEQNVAAWQQKFGGAAGKADGLAICQFGQELVGESIAACGLSVRETPSVTSAQVGMLSFGQRMKVTGMQTGSNYFMGNLNESTPLNVCDHNNGVTSGPLGNVWLQVTAAVAGNGGYTTAVDNKWVAASWVRVVGCQPIQNWGTTTPPTGHYATTLTGVVESRTLNTTMRTASVIDRSGILRFFAVSSVNGYLYETLRYPNGEWSAATSMGIIATDSPFAMVDSDGITRVFVRGQNNVLWENSNATSGSWSGWTSVTSWGVATSPAVVAEGPNALRFFIVHAADNQILEARRVNGIMGNWSYLSVPALTQSNAYTALATQSAPAAFRGIDGRTTLVVRTLDQKLFAYEEIPGQPWSVAINIHNGPLVDAPAIVGLDGQPMVIIRQTDGLVLTMQKSANTTVFTQNGAIMGMPEGGAINTPSAVFDNLKLRFFIVGVGGRIYTGIKN